MDARTRGCREQKDTLLQTKTAAQAKTEAGVGGVERKLGIDGRGAQDEPGKVSTAGHRPTEHGFSLQAMRTWKSFQQRETRSGVHFGKVSPLPHGGRVRETSQVNET